ncbi:hypothetical protein Tco_0811174 [Tanacetum coccineum]
MGHSDINTGFQGPNGTAYGEAMNMGYPMRILRHEGPTSGTTVRILRYVAIKDAYDRLQAKLAELNGGLDGSLIKEPLRDAGEVSQPVGNERIQEAHQDKSAPMMMFFPGTTRNGDYILPFKTGAFLAKAHVLPVILKYPYERFSPAWDSIWGLPVYYHSQEEKDDSKLYAENVRRLMAREGNLTMTEIGLAEKRVYQAARNGRPTVLLQKED